MAIKKAKATTHKGKASKKRKKRVAEKAPVKASNNAPIVNAADENEKSDKFHAEVLTAAVPYNMLVYCLAGIGLGALEEDPRKKKEKMLTYGAIGMLIGMLFGIRIRYRVYEWECYARDLSLFEYILYRFWPLKKKEYTVELAQSEK